MEAPVLAVASVARLKHPWGDDRLAGFVDGVDRVNRLAEASPGFRWRHRGPAGHADLIEAFGLADLLLNVSVWEDYASFHAFTYRGLHGRYLTARERWFVPVEGPTTALWWIDDDRRPDPSEALARITVLRREGPTPRAFTVLRRWRSDGTPEQVRASRTARARRLTP